MVSKSRVGFFAIVYSFSNNPDILLEKDIKVDDFLLLFIA
ncbi:hypothetical protein HPS8415995_0708 [Glaesserella parasuis 84-15995]|nr:hypothetical protein HPS8415995_0708 [Glaesserella parasuis 84-15995]